MAVRSASPSIFSAAFFSRAVLSVASVGIEDEDGTVFAEDLDCLGGGALVEQAKTRFPFVGRNPVADGLPGGRKGGGCRREAGGVSFFARLGGGR
jgi:hypothetical protein